MTTNELVDYVSDVLNLNAPDARTRIAREMNVRYKQVTSSIGMAPARRFEVSQVSTNGSDKLTFTGLEKLDGVYRIVSGPTMKKIVLAQVSTEELLETHQVSPPPTAFAIYSILPTSVTIQMNTVATATPFTLYGTCLKDVSTLTNLDAPALPESFHDILIHGVLADEYKRKDKGDFAKDEEIKFQERLSDLRMFLAKSAYLQQYRGKHAKAEGWWDSSLSSEGQYGIIP